MKTKDFMDRYLDLEFRYLDAFDGDIYFNADFKYFLGDELEKRESTCFKLDEIKGFLKLMDFITGGKSEKDINWDGFVPVRRRYTLPNNNQQ